MSASPVESWRTPSHFVGVHAKLTGHDAEFSNSNDCSQCQKLDRHHQEVPSAAAGPALALSRCHPAVPQEQVQWLIPSFCHAKLSVRDDVDVCNPSGTARGGPSVLDCPAVSQCASHQCGCYRPVCRSTALQVRSLHQSTDNKAILRLVDSKRELDPTPASNRRLALAQLDSSEGPRSLPDSFSMLARQRAARQSIATIRTMSNYNFGKPSDVSAAACRRPASALLTKHRAQSAYRQAATPPHAHCFVITPLDTAVACGADGDSSGRSDGRSATGTRVYCHCRCTVLAAIRIRYRRAAGLQRGGYRGLARRCRLAGAASSPL